MKDFVVINPKLHYPLQEKLGGEEVRVELMAGEKLRQLLLRVCKERQCEGMVFENGRLKPSLIVLVNQQNINILKGEYTELRPEDEITIVPAIAGG